MNQISSLANFIGPIIGGMLYGIWGISIILKVSILCFLLSAVMEMFIVIPFSKQCRQDKIIHIVRNDLQDSLKFIKFEKPVFIQGCLVIAGLNMFFFFFALSLPVLWA